MSSGLRQLDSSGKLKLSASGKVILASTGDPCCCGACGAICGSATPSFTVTLSGVSLDTGCLHNFLGHGIEDDPGTTITGGTINGTYSLLPYSPPAGSLLAGTCCWRATILLPTYELYWDVFTPACSTLAASGAGATITLCVTVTSPGHFSWTLSVALIPAYAAGPFFYSNGSSAGALLAVGELFGGSFATTTCAFPGALANVHTGFTGTFGTSAGSYDGVSYGGPMTLVGAFMGSGGTAAISTP
jgi:hypothetical protein